MNRSLSGHRVGEGHQKAKLTDAQVKSMREKYLPFVCGYGSLAKEFGCGQSTVRDIVQYRTRYDI